MDLAKNLAQWRDTPPEQVLAQINRFLPSLIVVILIVLIAGRAADLTWRLLEDPADQAAVPAPAPGTRSPDSASAGSGLQTLADWHPFGVAPVPDAGGIPAAELLDAPETSLPLTLRLTLVFQPAPERGTTFIPEGGVATIQTGRADQKTYHTGETIDGAQGAKLLAVFADHVAIERGDGKKESLSFPTNEELTQRSSPAGSSLSAAMRRNPAPPTEPGGAVQMTEAMGKFASTLGQYIRTTTATENGQMLGVRVQPQNDPQVFQQLGFEPGDILTEVNGVALNDARNLANVFQALAESSQATVRVRRNGNEQVLVIDTGQIQRLAESRQ